MIKILSKFSAFIFLNAVLAKEEATKEILNSVKEYYKTFMVKPEYKAGDRISYASRVFDEKEMMNLTDSALEFWLTSGRYTDQFEKQLGEYLGTPFVSLVNSGSSANLLAFMTLTSPLLKERQVKRGDEVITVACGFPTTVTPILQYGAVPVFVALVRERVQLLDRFPLAGIDEFGRENIEKAQSGSAWDV